MGESAENLSLQTPEQQVDAFLQSLSDDDFGVLALMRGSLEGQIREFLLGSDLLQLIISVPLGRIVLPPHTYEKIMDQKKKMCPLLEKLIGSPSTIQALEQGKKAIKKTTEQESKNLENAVRKHSGTSEQLPPPHVEFPSDQIPGKEITPEKVQEVWHYITNENDGKFYSPSLGWVTWGRSKYKHVCTTGAYKVASLLTGYPMPKNTNRNKYDEKLKAMHYTKILDQVNPKNPVPYLPKDGDVAVWPKFQLVNGKITQHMATYINGHRVSDTIQKRMSCYPNQPNEPNVKIYRYNYA